MSRALILALLAALAAPAAAQPGPETPPPDSATPTTTLTPPIPANEQALLHDYPVVELVTMGIGARIWERHGHVALCVQYADPEQDTCYNYGIAEFEHPLRMAAGFFRGTNSFWAGAEPMLEMFSIYWNAHRPIWVQPLPLTPAQKDEVIAKLKADDQLHYAYDHFWDNCTTRVRDILDHATHGALSSMKEPSDGRTYRDLAREGFYGMHLFGLGGRVPLLITDLAMGAVTDRVPSYYERMFLPQYLREAVQTKWGIVPIPEEELLSPRLRMAVDQRFGLPAVPVSSEAGAPPRSGAGGRWLFALLVLVLTSPAWITRLVGRFERTGLAVAVLPPALFGAIFWFLAIISPLPYVRWNETCLVLLPADLLLVWFLRPERRRRYARGRVAMLGVIAALMIVGIIKQPLWAALLWPLVPAAVVGFWPTPPPAPAPAPGKKPRKR